MKAKKLEPLPGIIPAMDMPAEKCFEFAEKLSDTKGITAYKIGSLPVMEKGFESFKDFPGNKIYDHQKGASDIPHIVEKQIELAANYDFQGVIGNPLGAGRKTLERFAEKAYELGIIPIVVVEMTHPEATSYSSREKCEELAKDFAEMGGKYIVAPATKPERIKAYKEIGENYGEGFLVISPGVGPQKTGNAVEDAYNAVLHGADYVVIGRAIYKAENPVRAVEKIYEAITKAYEERENEEKFA